MPFHIPNLEKKLQKVAGRIGHAVCVLPDKHRDPVIDGLLAAMTAAHADPDTTPFERKELQSGRERLLSVLASSPLKVQLEHGDELEAAAEKDSVASAKRREDLSLKRHLDAYMAEAKRKYVPPTKI